MAKEKKVVPNVEEDDSEPKSELLEGEVEETASKADDDEALDEDDLEEESSE